MPAAEILIAGGIAALLLMLKGDAVKMAIGPMKLEEGFSPTPYSDYQQESIGYGSRYVDGVTPNPITENQAAALMDSQLRANYAPAVTAAMTRKAVKLSAGSKAALIMFAYNNGPGALGPGKWFDYFAAGDMAEARSRFLMYHHAGGQDIPGLIQRRRREWVFLRTGRYPGLVNLSEEDLPL